MTSWPAAAVALAARRARAQAPLLAAVAACALVALTVLGTGALLLTAGRADALAAAFRGADPGSTAVLARVVPAADADTDPGALAHEVADRAGAAVAPLPAGSAAWTESPLLAAGDGWTYLAAAPDLPELGRLTAGRWPSGRAGGAWEVAVPEAAAVALGLAPGDELALPVPGGAAGTTTTVRVVGLLAPAGVGGTGEPRWSRDLLAGAGADPDHDRPGTGGRRSGLVAGPLLLAPSAVPGAADGPATGTGAVAVLVAPDAVGAAVGDLERVAAAVPGLRADLARRLGDRADRVVVRSELPRTLTTALTQHAVTGAAVLTATAATAGLGLVTLLLAGRLLATRRAAERELLGDRGASRGQLAGLAAVEALVVVGAAAVLAGPASAGAYRALVSLPPLGVAGLPAVDRVPAPVAGALVVAAAVLVGALVLPSLRTRRRRSRRRVGALARSGGDLLLVALAAVAALRLRALAAGGAGLPGGAGGGVDAVRVLAPLLVLLAAAALALRLLPLLGRLGERGAARSRGLVLPLAGYDLARRPRAATALLLTVLAAAGAGFGVAWGSTWSRSQGEQAEALVPAPVVVTGLPGTALEQGAAARAAAGGEARPATDRVVALGTLTGSGSADETTRLVAVDTRAAPPTGRVPAGTSWADLVAGLPPDGTVTGAPVRAPGGVVTLTVRGDAGEVPDLAVTPTVVLDDGHGTRVGAVGTTVPLDGAAHAVAAAVPGSLGPGGGGVAGGVSGPAAGAPAGLRVVAVVLRVGAPLPRTDDGSLRPVPAAVAVTVSWAAPGDAAGAEGGGAAGGDGAVEDDPVPGDDPALGDDPAAAGDDAAVRDAPAAGDVPWEAGVPDRAAGAVERVAAGAAGDGVRVAADLDVLQVALAPTDLVVTAFARPGELPVLVSADLAAGAGLRAGDTLEAAVGSTPLVARVAGVAPYVPGSPDAPTVLADLDALSRAALAQGETVGLTDRWDLPAGADLAALQGSGARVTVRAEVAAELRDGPLRAGVPGALALLVAAALLLAVAGSALHAAEQADARAPEVARLLAVGASERAVRATQLVQHGGVDLLAVVVGAAAGAGAASALAPALTVSPAGGRPVPEPLVVWPWAAEAGVLGLLLVGSTLVAVPVVRAVVRRATAAHLRLGDE